MHSWYKVLVLLGFGFSHHAYMVQVVFLSSTAFVSSSVEDFTLKCRTGKKCSLLRPGRILAWFAAATNNTLDWVRFGGIRFVLSL